MGKFTVTHEIHCNVETFWKLFFDKAFNEKLYLEGLGFPAYKTLEQNETETRITRRVEPCGVFPPPRAAQTSAGSAVAAGRSRTSAPGPCSSHFAR